MEAWPLAAHRSRSDCTCRTAYSLEPTSQRVPEPTIASPPLPSLGKVPSTHKVGLRQPCSPATLTLVRVGNLTQAGCQLLSLTHKRFKLISAAVGQWDSHTGLAMCVSKQRPGQAQSQGRRVLCPLLLSQARASPSFLSLAVPMTLPIKLPSFCP